MDTHLTLVPDTPASRLLRIKHRWEEINTICRPPN
jgi:hypothetical protein